jgi:hypothetical protein
MRPEYETEVLMTQLRRSFLFDLLNINIKYFADYSSDDKEATIFHELNIYLFVKSEFVFVLSSEFFTITDYKQNSIQNGSNEMYILLNKLLLFQPTKIICTNIGKEYILTTYNSQYFIYALQMRKYKIAATRHLYLPMLLLSFTNIMY